MILNFILYMLVILIYKSETRECFVSRSIN